MTCETIQAMYRSAACKTRVSNDCNDKFSVHVGVYNGLILTPHLFIIDPRPTEQLRLEIYQNYFIVDDLPLRAAW